MYAFSGQMGAFNALQYRQLHETTGILHLVDYAFARLMLADFLNFDGKTGKCTR